MGETAAAGGVFIGLGLRGVRGSGAAEAVGVTGAPLGGGPAGETRPVQMRASILAGGGEAVLPWEALSKLLMSVLTVGEGSEEVEDLLLRPIPCRRAARSLSTAFM